MKPLNVPGPKAKELIERDQAVISPSYPRAHPFVMDHGKGSEVWDIDGNRFIDFASGIAVCSTGHCHPKVVESIKNQVDKFIHISSDFYHPVWVEFSDKIASTAPFEEPAKVFLGNSGTEAVEAAIKLARYHTGRQHFIGFYGAFHGRTMGSLAFTSSKTQYRENFGPMMNGVTHVPYPDAYRPILVQSEGEDYGEAVVRYIEEVVLTRTVPPQETAAIMVEPILGEGGYIVPTPGFFPALRSLCDKHGILLIVDEVQSGVGRTGKWWAIEHWGVEPDIVCFAKGIASGMPLGGILARASVMDWPKGAHGNTYGGNPVSCGAGLATLELIENGFMKNAAEVGEYTLDALSEIMSRHTSIGQVRGKGLMIGIEFVKDRESKKRATDLRDRIVEKAFHNGVITLGSGKNSIRISPALNISQDLVNEGLMMLEEAITSAEAEA
ncbi:MAG TPA: acetyl ornithine aminotransferase family protein [Anaerolineales bacterium]|nr:acetyl ornithine aminotransferase family protein [Anaerolineales bacterium]